MCLYINFFYFSFLCSFGFCGNLFSSMSFCGDVSDMLVSLLLPVASRTSVAHLDIALCTPFLFLPHFDIICDLLLNRHTATWYPFVKCIE